MNEAEVWEAAARLVEEMTRRDPNEEDSLHTMWAVGVAGKEIAAALRARATTPSTEGG